MPSIAVPVKFSWEVALISLEQLSSTVQSLEGGGVEKGAGRH